MTNLPLRTAGLAASRIRSVLAALTLPALLAAQSEPAKPFAHPDGTTHWYRAVPTPEGSTWDQAQAAALAAGGYLASITSAKENEFVFGLVDSVDFWRPSSNGRHHGPWIGGVAVPSNAGRMFAWTELEPFTYTAWEPGEPDKSQSQDRIHFGSSRSGRTPTWANCKGSSLHGGYVIEFSGALSPRTIGLKTRLAESQDGYTLLNLLNSTDTILIDPRGREVRRWRSKYGPGASAYLLPDGHLMRAGKLSNDAFDEGGSGGIIEKFDWNGNLVWSFQHSSDTYCLHHDFEVLPSGNILMIAWEKKSDSEALGAGRQEHLLEEGELWPLKVIEVRPSATGNGGTIVWEWHSFDHVVQDHDDQLPNYGAIRENPHRIDINYVDQNVADWMHSNSIDYNPDLDQILISVRSFCEVWVIDHSTTTAEAKGSSGGRSGMGGDLLYRWGNPFSYGIGTTDERQLFYQHDAQWIPKGYPGAGNILIFNNGPARSQTAPWSSVDEIVPPKPDTKGRYAKTTEGSFAPDGPKWTWAAPEPASFYSGFVSGAQRLRNGNTLICGGAVGRILEVTAEKKVVWDYDCPIRMDVPFRQGTPIDFNQMFRAPRYEPDFPAFRGKTLTPGEPLEKHGSVLLANGSTADEVAGPGDAIRFDLKLEVETREPRRYYHVLTSMTEGVIPVDFRAARIGADPILDLSLSHALPEVFERYFGFLDESGRAVATLRLPRIAELHGTSLHTAFAVSDPEARSGIHFLSNRVTVHVTR